MPFYETYLMLSQELNDIEGEAKACHFLGYAHYCLGNYKEAIRLVFNFSFFSAVPTTDFSTIRRLWAHYCQSHYTRSSLMGKNSKFKIS